MTFVIARMESIREISASGLHKSVEQEVLSGVELLADFARDIPPFWDGQRAILEMKANSFPQWKQMEWPGFYLEFLSKRLIAPIFGEPSQQFGSTRFDGFLGVPWDLKCKGLFDSSGKASTSMYLNDEQATRTALDQFGLILLVVVVGQYIFDDEDQSFYHWHEKLKGEKSAYQLGDPSRRSRIRKSGFTPSELKLFSFNEQDLEGDSPLLSLRSQGKNSNGRPRPRKWLLDLAEVQPDHSIKIG